MNGKMSYFFVYSEKGEEIFFKVRAFGVHNKIMRWKENEVICAESYVYGSQMPTEIFPPTFLEMFTAWAPQLWNFPKLLLLI